MYFGFEFLTGFIVQVKVFSRFGSMFFSCRLSAFWDSSLISKVQNLNLSSFFYFGVFRVRAQSFFFIWLFYRIWVRGFFLQFKAFRFLKGHSGYGVKNSFSSLSSISWFKFFFLRVFLGLGLSSFGSSLGFFEFTFVHICFLFSFS